MTTDRRKALLEAFASDSVFEDSHIEELLGEVSAVAPAVDRRNALLEALDFSKRLARFAPRLAQMLDVDELRANALLAGVDNSLAWEPEPMVEGLSAVWVEGGASVNNCIRGFVRLAAGAEFPCHDHLGIEQVVVLQGFMDFDDGTVLGPGDFSEVGIGDEHGFRARPGGTDLLYFVVVHEGIAVGDVRLTHRD